MANRFLNNISINDEYTLPAADGTADQVLTTDGAGQLAFVDQITIASGSAEVVEVPVKNLQGSALTKGDPVYISGSVGTSGILEVQLADAGDKAKMPAVGLLKQDLAINAEGFAVVTGKLRNLITSPIDGATPSPNDVIYVKSGGSTGAALTTTKPTGSANSIQNMGKVGRVSTVSDGTFVVSSILRSNDIPNLPTGKIWVGTAANTTASTVVHLDETNVRLGLNETTPTQTLHVTGNARVTGAVYDSSNSAGTSGQVLSSTGTGTQWTTGGGGGGVSGSGTTDYLPKWSNSTTLTDSAIYHNIAGEPTVNAGTDFNLLTGSRLVLSSAGITQSENGTTIIDVLDASDLPSTLAANTTYVIHGNLTVTSAITVSNDNCAVIGRDRNKDRITFSAKNATLFTITDVSFAMQDLTLSSTDSTSTLIDATDVASTGYNNSRDHFFTLVNCQFRNVVGDLMTVRGFDLVDFNNTTFFYIESPNFGCRFEDVSKLEISSCEFIRWFSESSLPTPSGYATCDMIELMANNLSSFGAVNISGCIIHPQQTQFALNISSSSTTGFGTIAANAFVNVGITTGGILTGSTYNDTSMLKYDVFANQGLADSSAYVFGYQSGTDTQSATTSFASLTIATFLDGSIQRFTSLSTGLRYDGSKDIEVSIDAKVGLSGIGGNNESFEFQIYKLIGGTLISPLAGTVGAVELDSGEEGIVNLIGATSVSQNDVITVYYRSPTNDNFTLQDFAIRVTQV
jgi:hypothetical protein